MVSVGGPAADTSTTTKRLIAPFLVNAAVVPNLGALSSRLQEHYEMSLQQLCHVEQGGSAGQNAIGSEAIKMNVRVWLPDGLVPVRNDGEWMVALLSAEMIEWMDKQVKILVDFMM